MPRTADTGSSATGSRSWSGSARRSSSPPWSRTSGCWTRPRPGSSPTPPPASRTAGSGWRASFARPPDPTTDLAEGDDPVDALEQALDAIDADEWQALAAPLIEPVLAKAASDPDGLLADLAALYPTLDAEALTEQLARVLFVADVWGQLTGDLQE